jgi:hypothetical protein
MTKYIRFSDQLRKAIRDSDKSRYRIGKETGIDESILSRFVNQGTGLSMESIDKLSQCLGLRLVADVPRKKKSKQ